MIIRLVAETVIKTKINDKLLDYYLNSNLKILKLTNDKKIALEVIRQNGDSFEFESSYL
jgi:hypothetical protein